MLEVLPIKLLTDEDAPIFGNLNVALGKLYRAGLPVGNGIAVTPPQFKIKAVLEHFDFGAKEVFEQTLTLVKKEINAIPVPEALITGIGKNKQFLLAGERIQSIKNLWQALLSVWLDEIKDRLWTGGFAPGMTEGLSAKAVIFIRKMESMEASYFDPIQDDVQVQIKTGKLHPADLKKIAELTQLANKKLFIPHEYEWIIDGGIKLVSIKPYTPPNVIPDFPLVIAGSETADHHATARDDKQKSAVKVFFELSSGLTIEKDVDGIYIDSGKIYNLDKQSPVPIEDSGTGQSLRPDGLNPKESFEDLAFKLVESAMAFPASPVLFKLADLSEGMGKVRGTLRLLHQTSLFDPLTQVLDFARHKKGLTNIHIVIPYVRGVGELLQIKRELATKNLMRKNSLGVWMEVCVPENIINIDSYIEAGIDGVVLNLDELISHLNGFDRLEESLLFYKQEVEALLNFLEGSLKLLHKSKIPFIAYGNLALNPKVLEFLVEKGVMGIVVERFEAHSAYGLLYQVEKRVVLKKVI